MLEGVVSRATSAWGQVAGSMGEGRRTVRERNRSRTAELPGCHPGARELASETVGAERSGAAFHRRPRRARRVRPHAAPVARPDRAARAVRDTLARDGLGTQPLNNDALGDEPCAPPAERARDAREYGTRAPIGAIAAAAVARDGARRGDRPSPLLHRGGMAGDPPRPGVGAVRRRRRASRGRPAPLRETNACSARSACASRPSRRTAPARRDARAPSAAAARPPRRGSTAAPSRCSRRSSTGPSAGRRSTASPRPSRRVVRFTYGTFATGRRIADALSW